MRPILRVDFVASVQAQAERPPKPFNADTGINCCGGVAGCYVAEAVLEARGSLLIVSAEVDEAGLEGTKKRTGPAGIRTLNAVLIDKSA